MPRIVRLVALFVVTAVVTASCGGDDGAASDIPVDANGFPTDWPISAPPGNVSDCDNGHVNQDDSLFSVVMCLPEDPDPFTASQNYLGTLESEGFVEREPGAFIVSQETFLDGNGIEIYYQLIENEATIVLIRPGG